MSPAIGCGSENVQPSGSALLFSPTSAARSAADPATATPGALVAFGRQSIRIGMHDNCDPDTFNAAIAPDACKRNGGMKFDQFIAQLTRLGFVGPWHFAPNTVNARPGQTFVVVNQGGEEHTFTEVETFGGGIVPMLNTLAHVPNVAPECLTLDPDDFVEPGATYEEEVEDDAEGVEHYQCCIHPWMRVDAHIRASH
jgi:plastocyanin